MERPDEPILPLALPLPDSAPKPASVPVPLPIVPGEALRQGFILMLGGFHRVVSLVPDPDAPESVYRIADHGVTTELRRTGGQGWTDCVLPRCCACKSWPATLWLRCACNWPSLCRACWLAKDEREERTCPWCNRRGEWDAPWTVYELPVMKAEPVWNVVVRRLDGHLLGVRAAPSWSLHELMVAIHCRTSWGIPMDISRFVSGGRQLCAGPPIDEQGMRDGCEIAHLLRLCGD